MDVVGKGVHGAHGRLLLGWVSGCACTVMRWLPSHTFQEAHLSVGLGSCKRHETALLTVVLREVRDDGLSVALGA